MGKVLFLFVYSVVGLLLLLLGAIFLDGPCSVSPSLFYNLPALTKIHRIIEVCREGVHPGELFLPFFVMLCSLSPSF